MTVDVESELRSLQRTYRSSGFRLTKLLSPAQIRIALDFECKDPDYRQHYPRLKSLPLEIVLPDDYPNDAPRFRIVDGRPEPIRRVITQGLDWFCEGRRGQPMIIASLKWLDDNLDGLMSLGSQLLSQESQKSASKTEDANDWSPEQQSQLENALKLVPKSAAPSPEQRWLRIADHVQGKSAEQCIERFRTIRSALQAEQERQSKVQKITANLQEIAFESASSAPLEPIQEPNTVPLSQCMQVAFPSIQLLSIAMARMQLARFSCRCSRCRTMFDMALTPTQTQNGVCQKCHEPWTALFSFEIVHIANCRFGNVQTVNCDIIDYLPSNVWISCECCSSDLLLERIESGPKKCYATCRECHSHMTLICGEVVLSESSCSRSVLPTAKPKQETPQKKRPARALQTSDSGIIKKGEPLPDFGTCKHYSKSYRWLRFPCCGKAFPCDICHELGTASNPHAMKWALRQICGFCAQESAIIGSGKCPCGKSTTRANSEYWNGGQGMRDQSRMARNDSKKHAGLLKTRSQKHKRVGQKPS